MSPRPSVSDQRKDPILNAVNAISQLTGKPIRDYTYPLRLLPIAGKLLALAFRGKTVQKALKNTLRFIFR